MRHEYPVVGAIIGLGLLLRAQAALNAPVLTDGAITWWFATQFSFHELLLRFPTMQPHFPTFYILLKLFSDLMPWFGAVDVGRGISVVAGTGTILGTYIAARELIHERGAVLAAAFVATSPFAIEMSVWIRMYALLALFGTLSWWAAATVAEKPSRYNLCIYAVLSIATVWMHYLGVIVIGSQVLWMWIDGGFGARIRSSAVFGIAGLPAIAWVMSRVYTAQQPTTDYKNVIGLRPPGLVDFVRMPINLLVGNRFDHGVWLYGQPISFRLFVAIVLVPAAALLLLIGLYRVYQRGLTMSQKVILCWAGVPFVALGLYSILLTPVFRARYLVVVSIGLMIGLAYAIDTRPRRYMRVTLVILVLSAFLIVGFSSSQPTYTSDAFDSVEKSTPKAEYIATIGFFPKDVKYRIKQRNLVLVGGDYTVPKLQIGYAVGGNQSVWVLHNHRSPWRTRTFCPQWVGLQNHSIASHSRIDGIHIYKVTPTTDENPQTCPPPPPTTSKHSFIEE